MQLEFEAASNNLSLSWELFFLAFLPIKGSLMRVQWINDNGGEFYEILLMEQDFYSVFSRR